MATRTLPLDAARALAERALGVIGYAEVDAAAIADHLIDCELRGLEYSGLARILSIRDRLGDAGPSSEPIRTTRESTVSAQLDGGDQVGYLVARRATELAIEKANASGLAVVGANRTWYTGMLSYYAERIVAEGMVAFIASNASPWVAPYGGSEAMFGTNPICFGFPSTGEPVIWDIGISEIIHAQAVIAHRTGRQLPEGVAYGPAGRPTRDPIEALQGAFVNWGGHRGYGLGIVVQLLGTLAGSPAMPPEMRDFGFFVLALQPELFGDPDRFRSEVASYAEALRSSRPLEPDQPVRVPFVRSACLRAERIARNSIDVESVVVDALHVLIEGRSIARADR